MTFRADKLPPPPKTESYTELYRWNYRLFELVNAIQSLIAAGVGNTAVGIITATNLQAVVSQLNTILSSITANLATTVVSEETFGIADAVGVSTVYARQDHTHGTPADPVPAHVAAADPHPVYLTAAEGTAAYAPIAKGVTNGDSHDHNGGDGAQIDHAGLANLATGDPHTQYQQESERDAASGYAGLNASSRTTKGTITTDDLIVNLATKGLVLKDTQGTPHYWRLTVTTLGVLVTTDLGTSAP